MSLCPLTRILAPLSLAAVVIAGVARAETPAQPPKLVLKVYTVADLIVPIPGNPISAVGRACTECKAAQCASKPCCAGEKSGCCAEKPVATAPQCAAAHASAPTCEAHLIKLIANSIAPQSWADAGGRGTIE